MSEEPVKCLSSSLTGLLIEYFSQNSRSADGRPSLTRRVTNKTPLQNVQLGISSLLFETP
jgi:hypothetical protein